MQALLLIAHGSRREASNQEVRELAEKISVLSGDKFSSVEAAFLELAKPDIPEGVSRCVAAGASDVMVVPYFLSAGKHVAIDIPEELEKARINHPDILVQHSDYLGKHLCIPNILLALADADSQLRCIV